MCQFIAPSGLAAEMSLDGVETLSAEVCVHIRRPTRLTVCSKTRMEQYIPQDTKSPDKIRERKTRLPKSRLFV
jgi:hypothetical protein